MKAQLLDSLKKITSEEEAILNGRGEINASLYNLTSTMIVDASHLMEKGHLIDLRPHTRFAHFPAHRHNFVEMVYMCSGQTHHKINGMEVFLNEGELLLLSQNTIQEIFPAGENDIALNFIVLPQFLNSFFPMLEGEHSMIRSFLVECLQQNSKEIGYLHFHVAEVLPVQNLIENLIWLLLGEETNRNSLSQTTMGLLLLHLLRFTEKISVGKEHFSQGILLHVLRYLEEHYVEGSLSILAANLGYDLYWLSRNIKQWTGKTYTQLLQEKRLTKAAYLLKHTTLSITDVCLDVGYHNFSYFYKIFKATFGLSPRGFRVKHQKSQEKTIL